MSTSLNHQDHTDESPFMRGMIHTLKVHPLKIPANGGDLSIADSYSWVNVISHHAQYGPLIGFDMSITYTSDHLNTLAQVVQTIGNSELFRSRGEIPIVLIREWQELQGKVLIDTLAPEIEHIAGNTLTALNTTRTRIGDILEKSGSIGAVKAGSAAASFGIMGLFQYRFMESLLQAIAQSDINQGKSGAIAQLVQSQGALMGTGMAWSVLTTCTFAYLVKAGFETHLSDKLIGTSRLTKKTLCALGCAALLGIEMTGSFSRITIGTDLKEQVVDMKKGLTNASTGKGNVFTQLATQANTIGDQYENEGKKMYADEAKRGGIGPYAAAKQSSYLPKSQLDQSKYSAASLQPKVDALYSVLQKHTDTMIAIQDKNGITVPSSKLELSAPGAIYDAGYHFVKSGEKLGKDSSISVDTLLESHNLMDPSFYDVVMDLVLDAGKKLHPSDVNTLRKELDARIISAGTNVDALSVELSKTIDTIDGFMQDIVRSANTAYPNSPSSYTPKEKPPTVDTSALKNALNNTKVPVTVLDPFGVWSKYMNLSSNGTIPAGYSLTLILRVLLVEGMLLLMGLLRIRQTKKALSTPGARFEDLSRETDGTYLEILRKVSKITGGEAWTVLNGKPLTEEQLHTIVTTALSTQDGQSGLGNHLSVVDSNGKKINSKLQSMKELLGAAFFGQYSAPEIRRIRDLDRGLISWRDDITGKAPTQDMNWIKQLQSWGQSMKNTSSDHPDDTEDAMTRSAPTHNVRDTISKILSGSNALKRISDMSQKRHVGESTIQKEREWKNIRDGLKEFFDTHPELMRDVNQARNDTSHPLYLDIKVLDETGDLFGYYQERAQSLGKSWKGALGTTDEKTFFAQGEKYTSEIGSILQKALLGISRARIAEADDISVINNLIGKNSAELLEEESHNRAIGIILKYQTNEYIKSTVLNVRDWKNTPAFHRDKYTAGLGDIMARLDNAYDVRIQQKQYKKYTEVSGENSTELQVMNLRNSSAQVKQYFAEKVEQQNSIIHISSRFPS